MKRFETMAATTTKHYDDPKEFYAALKASRASKQQLELPSNSAQLVQKIDEASMSENVTKLTSGFKQSFVVVTYLLHLAYKNRVRENRKQVLSELRKRANTVKEEKDATTEEPLTAKPRAEPRVSKSDSVPDYIRACKSNLVKTAVALFCVNSGIKEQLRVRILYHMMYVERPELQKILKMNKDELKTLSIPDSNSVDANVEKTIVQTFMELAEILSDKTYAKFAALVNEEIYIAAAKWYIQKNNKFSTIYPYEHLISRYLRECVAPKYIDQEQNTIMKQFEVNPQSTITYVIKELSETNEFGGQAQVNGSALANNALTSKKRRSTVESSNTVDPDMVYEVFRGPINYKNRLLVTNVNRDENKVYRIITYNDCLYDVVGCSTDTMNENGVKINESVIYNRLSWSERLNLIPYRAKIELDVMSGEDINNYKGNASLTVSWMENGYECQKTLNIKNERQQR